MNGSIFILPSFCSRLSFIRVVRANVANDRVGHGRGGVFVVIGRGAGVICMCIADYEKVCQAEAQKELIAER